MLFPELNIGPEIAECGGPFPLHPSPKGEHMTSTPNRPGAEATEPSYRLVFILTGVLTVAFLVSQWATLAKLAERWSSDPQYSHGFLVPVFALVVLWFRRERIEGLRW